MIIIGRDLEAWILAIHGRTAEPDALLDLNDVQDGMSNTVGELQVAILPPGKPPANATTDEHAEWLLNEMDQLSRYASAGIGPPASPIGDLPDLPDEDAVDLGIRAWMMTCLRRAQMSPEARFDAYALLGELATAISLESGSARSCSG